MSIDPNHFAAPGKRVCSEYDPEQKGTVLAWMGGDRMIVKWDNQGDFATWCYPHDLEPLNEDPAPYLNPNNGERTSFPHAESVHQPRTAEQIRAAIAEQIANPSGLTLSAAIAAVTAACEAAGVDGYNGEAVFYLDALLGVERGGDPTDAVRASYGLDEEG